MDGRRATFVTGPSRFKATVAFLLKNIYVEGELSRGATIQDYLVVRQEGARQVSRTVLHCNLKEDAMTQTSTKDLLRETADKLPTDASVEDAMALLLFLAKIERGLEQADADKTVSHEEVGRHVVTIPLRSS
jgi:hypothetical protein